jgi:hypothetical protein
MNQYAVRVRMPAVVPYGNGTEYWIPAFAGMTPEYDFRSIPTAPQLGVIIRAGG